MESKNTKYCVYCGKEIPVDSWRRVHCGEWLNKSSVTRNHTPYTYTPQENIYEEKEDLRYTPNKKVENNNENYSNDYNNINGYNRESTNEYSKIFPIRKLFLLMIFTCGLYSIYWIYKTNCYLRDDLGKDVSPGLRTFLFVLIPIANIIVFYQTLEDMNYFIKKEGIKSYSSGWNTFIMMFLSWIVSFWVYVNIQESINEFWRIKEANLTIMRDFSNSEIVVMVLGPIFWFLVFVFYIVLLAYIGSMVFV